MTARKILCGPGKLHWPKPPIRSTHPRAGHLRGTSVPSCRGLIQISPIETGPTGASHGPRCSCECACRGAIPQARSISRSGGKCTYRTPVGGSCAGLVGCGGVCEQSSLRPHRNGTHPGAAGVGAPLDTQSPSTGSRRVQAISEFEDKVYAAVASILKEFPRA